MFFGIQIHGAIMNKKTVWIAVFATATLAVGLWLGTAQAGAPQAASAAKEKPLTTHRAVGPFDVKLAPVKSDAIDPFMGAMSIDKQFHGALEGTSKGLMLAVSTDVKGSAGYVAMEKVTGTLDGRKGTFVLQHTATMDRGKPDLSITVVPDSGTGELVGLAGKLDVQIAEGGKHSYVFDYSLPAAQ
jgi:Protein of unknown function (DUF3224)